MPEPITAVPDASETPGGDRRFATTLARGLSVLRAFRGDDDGLANAEIARRTGLPKATVSRLTHTLTQLGYLTRPAQGERYRPGPALLAVGHVAQASLGYLAAADRPMQDLANRSGTLAFLAVRDRDKILLARTWRPEGTASIWFDTGWRVPIAGAAAGQAILAGMDDAQIDAVLADQPPGGLGRDQAAALRAQALDQCLTRGFVVPPPGQRNSDRINSVAVPFRSPLTAEPVALSCGAMRDQLTERQMIDDVGPALRDIVAQLARTTGQLRPLTAA